VAGAVAVCSWGCADERPPALGEARGRPAEGCTQFSYQPCDILAADCQSELFRLVACLRGEDVATVGPPPVSLLTEAEATSMVRATTEELAEPTDAEDFSATVRGLELLGLLDPGLITTQSDVLDVTIQAVAAFYQPSTREVVIIDRGEVSNDLEANAMLAHEFVHAWQDRRHDLGSFGNEPGIDSDRALALSSVVEGEAMLYQLLLLLAYRGVSLDRANYTGMFQSLIDQAEQLSVTNGSPMVTASEIFPYTYGARYMGERWLAASQDGLDQIFEQPPQSSLEVMWRGSNANLPSVEPFSVLPAPLAGYRFVADDVAGAWVMFSRLLEVPADVGSDSTALRQLSTGWKGDRFWVYQSEDAALDTAVVWWTDWVDAASASRFADLLGPNFPVESGVGLQIRARGPRTLVVVTERSADGAAWAERAEEALPL
jgi:hypothetical protein